jgi:hypothetical protein
MNSARCRSKLGEKVKWDGLKSSFKEYSQILAGHLLQVGAGYLVSTGFVKKYLEQGAAYFKTDEFWYTHSTSEAQALSDRSALYGLLLSSNKPDQSILLQYDDSQDGILAWAQFQTEWADDGNEGSKALRVEVLESLVSRHYSLDDVDGLTGYVDRFQKHMAQLSKFLPGDYSDGRKRRLLLRSIRDTKSLLHLYQPLYDDKSKTYEQCATYLRNNAAMFDHVDSQSRPVQVQQVAQELPEPPLQVQQVTQQPPMDLASASRIFMAVAADQGPVRAFQTFQSPAIRERLSIPYPIWQQLEPIIRDKIVEIRKGIQAKNRPPPAPVPVSAPAAIPAQYPDMKANMATSRDVTLNLCNTLAGMDFSDDGDDTDDELLNTFHLNMITVRAHLEYAEVPWGSQKIYAISDCGADSTILGKYAKGLHHTNRFANLVGYDPQTTRTEKVPIVCALIKARSNTEGSIPVLLHINEAPLLANSPITLISEYQVR